MISLTVTYTATADWQGCFDAMREAAEFYYDFGILLHPRETNGGFTWKHDQPHIYFRDKAVLSNNVLGIAFKSFGEVAIKAAQPGRVTIHELGHVIMHDDGHRSGTFMDATIEKFRGTMNRDQRRKIRKGARIWGG